MAEDAEVGVYDGDCKDETDERLLRSKNLNKATGYFIPNAKQVFIQLRQTFSKAQSFNTLIRDVISKLRLIFRAIPLVES